MGSDQGAVWFVLVRETVYWFSGVLQFMPAVVHGLPSAVHPLCPPL
jgi:hypothetical protein